MSVFLNRFAAERAPDEHAVLVLDQAGWHSAHALRIPDNVTLVPLPPYSPELNPVERVWLYLRERSLSHRLLDSYDAIVDACCAAWNRLTPERLRSLCQFPYTQQVSFWARRYHISTTSLMRNMLHRRTPFSNMAPPCRLRPFQPARHFRDRAAQSHLLQLRFVKRPMMSVHVSPPIASPSGRRRPQWSGERGSRGPLE